MAFKEIKAEELNNCVFTDVGKKWMLISAQKKDGSINTMTASWGAMGVLWNKNVFFCFVRPQRYTHEFTEESDKISISFFGEEYRDSLTFCGRNSGRDCDKAKETGLTPKAIDGSMGFEESRLTLVCEKIYYQDLDPKGFVDETLDSKNYAQKDYHRMYVGKIVSCYIS